MIGAQRARDRCTLAVGREVMTGMTTVSNAAFYRDVFGVPVEQAEHLDDVQPCLIPVSDNEGD